MNPEIAPIPDIPEAIREAAQLAKLVPFIGAGASKLAGCPDWDEFANGALRLFVDHGKFSHAQLDQIKHLRPRIQALDCQSGGCPNCKVDPPAVTALPIRRMSRARCF